jgi:RNA polymerase sigma-70 factor (ECF subfamily)
VQDFELIEKIKNDDQNALAELIRIYKQSVFTVAMGILHDQVLTEDVVQDVFIKFWEIRQEFELTAKFSTWLYRVTLNKAISMQRRNKIMSIFSSMSSKDDEDQITDYEMQIPDDSVITSDKRFKDEHIKIALKNAVDSLPKNQRIAFILAKYQDLSYKEIAEVMDTTLASVESLLHRAKDTLQKNLFITYKSL